MTNTNESNEQALIERYKVFPQSVNSGTPMFSVIDTLEGSSIGKLTYWQDEADKLSWRLNNGYA